MGTSVDFPEHLNRKLVLGNRVTAISGILVMFIGLLYIDVLPQFITYVGGAFFCFSFLILNYFNYTNFSRIFFTIIIPLFLTIGILLSPEPVRLPQKIGFLCCITIPLVLFGITELRLMILGIAWMVICYFAIDFVPFNFSVHEDTEVLFAPKAVEYFSEVVTFSVLICVFLYLQKLNLGAETKLKEMLEESILQKNEIQQQKLQLEKANRSLSVKALTAQLNPHFLYNSLNSIQHFLTINDKTSSLNYLSKFGRLIRQFIDYSDEGVIPLNEELKLLTYYLELETLRFGSLFSYRLKAEDDLLLYNIKVPLLLIQIHVENAILHGLINKEEGDRLLTIDFGRDDTAMLCVVEDNGVGREASSKLMKKRTEIHRSRGIEISTRRLRLMYPDLSSDYLVKIDDLYSEDGNPIGTRVNIRIPIEDL